MKRFVQCKNLGAIIKCDLMKDYSNFLINKLIDGIDDKEHRLKPLENF